MHTDIAGKRRITACGQFKFAVPVIGRAIPGKLDAHIGCNIGRHPRKGHDHTFAAQFPVNSGRQSLFGTIKIKIDIKLIAATIKWLQIQRSCRRKIGADRAIGLKAV